MEGDRFWKIHAQMDALRQAETEGRVADNLDYRKGLMQRVHDGEITLEQAQAELKAVKRNASKNGQITRSQARNGY
jgi:hypothetical protein